MPIILMRHGKPGGLSPQHLSAKAMAQWIASYDSALISDMPPQRCIDLAAQAEIIVASPLPRALGSLEKLGLRATYTDAIFREVALPVLPLATPALPPTLWLSLLRLLWLCGYSGSVESFRHARQRARLAASQLISLSEQGTVLLVGHGIMNKLIARELRRQGWLAEKHASSRYWSSAVYHRGFL
ncbi:histidine phosphatase family protein [Pantoea sp. FN0307]|uniref:histidine phosphatase family protein n=1 Tax=Pantoea sp. FN0307 TaxID=3418560 RepID=UPI003CEBF5B8